METNFVDKAPVDDKLKLKGITTRFKIVISLALLSYILAAMAVPLKQYVSLFCYGIAILAMCFLPLLKYFKKEKGKLAFVYIVFLNSSYLVIFPSATVGFGLHERTDALYYFFFYIPPFILAISFLIYLIDPANTKNMLRNTLRKMSIERENQIRALDPQINKQLSSYDVKNYRFGVYATTFITLFVLSISFAIIDNTLVRNDDGQFIFIGGFSSLIFSIFVIKSFFPKARFLHFVLSGPIILTIIFIPIGFSEASSNESDGLWAAGYLFGIIAWFFFFIPLWGIYKIWCSITRSKFARGADSNEDRELSSGEGS